MQRPEIEVRLSPDSGHSSADDKLHAGHRSWDTRNPVTRIVGRHLRFSGLFGACSFG
jgi:hypothetical protein